MIDGLPAAVRARGLARLTVAAIAAPLLVGLVLLAGDLAGLDLLQTIAVEAALIAGVGALTCPLTRSRRGLRTAPRPLRTPPSDPGVSSRSPR